MHDFWESVIGLEIHVQLKTDMKIFSPSSSSFGDEPNTHIHPCCTGQPGAYPRLSEKVVFFGIQLGIALQSKISEYIVFDRKSYFYPDSPRNYQITQFFYPLLTGGYLSIDLNEKEININIREAHLEDDTAILKHLPNATGIDFNRAGMPLIEIVTEPEIDTPETAVAFVSELILLLEYLGISDCDMEKGQLRIDANVSVRKSGENLRPKCEIKNLNSLNILGKALRSETERQIALYEAYPEKKPEEVITSTTFRWDGALKRLIKMRTKDTVIDYKYFLEPDMPIYSVDQIMIEEARSGMNELPNIRRKRLKEQYKLHSESIHVLMIDKKMCSFFEQATKTCTHFQALVNWITVEFGGQAGKPIYCTSITTDQVSELVNMIIGKKISGKNAKLVAAEMIKTPCSPIEILKIHPNLSLQEDIESLEAIVIKILKNHPDSIIDYRNGKGRALNFLVGKIMASAKQSNPETVKELLLKHLSLS